MFSDPYSPYASGGGYDMAGNYRSHTGTEYLFPDSSSYGGSLGLYGNNPMINNYYGSTDAYLGAYNSLSSYEQQLRMMQISQQERMVRWQQRLQFEELAEEERNMRWQMMAQEERMRLGLANQNSYWGSRYGGYGGLDNWTSSSLVSPWTSSRLPLTSALTTRFSPLYNGYDSSSSHYRRNSGFSGYSHNSMDSMYGGGLGMSVVPRRRSIMAGSMVGSVVGSVAGSVAMTAQLHEARRMQRHEQRAIRHEIRAARRLSRAGIY